MPQRTRGLVPWLVVGVVVAGSLLARVLYRGPYYPGWDVLGSSHGLHLLSTYGPWGTVVELWTKNRHYGQPFPYYSVVGALVPGALAALVPWDHWGQAVTFACVLVTLWLITRAAGLAAREAWIVPLAWSASPTLLTLAVCGYPWATALLPHALALWCVLDERLGRRPLVSLAWAAFTIEVAWHCYEPGRTVGAVFVAGALLVPHATMATRAAWLATGLTSVALVFSYPTMNVGPYVRPELMGPSMLATGLAQVARMLFVTNYLDLPMLVAAGLVACLMPSRVRLMVAGLFALQVLFVAAVAVGFPNASHVRPRRFVLVDGYALVLVTMLVRDAVGGTRLLRGVRAVVLGLLVVGSVWQVVDLVRFVRTPFVRGRDRFVFTQPYSQSQVDYAVNLEIVDWAEALIARVEHGERLLLVYNLDAYHENITDPSGVLERLYLRLGHTQFVSKVLVFGSHPCRQSACVPVRPMAEIDPALDRLQAEGPAALAGVTGYAVAPHPIDGPLFLAERAALLEAIAARFAVDWRDPETAKFRRFSLGSRAHGL